MTLWFHSHILGKTAEQVYSSLAGIVFIEDENSESLNLPTDYGVNDFPLILQERFFDINNHFLYNQVYNFVLSHDCNHS